MKIEVCESLIYSWFKHVKGCSIVQTNWKISPCWRLNLDQYISICQEVQNFFHNKYEYTLFKGANTGQYIKQGEIDVVGIKIQNNESYIYAADSAFHEDGLLYGSVKETVSRVLKKYFRTAITLRAVYGEVSGEIAFISPKINKNTIEPLKTTINDLQNILTKNGFKFSLTLYANESFTNEVLLPTKKIAKQVSDDNELFLRSIKLANFENNDLNNERVPVRPITNSSIGNRRLLTRTMYEEYLRNLGKAESTIHSYCWAIDNHVLERVNLNWNTLTNHIDEIVPLFDYGMYEQIGKIGHNTVICSIKRFREFVHYKRSSK